MLAGRYYDKEEIAGEHFPGELIKAKPQSNVPGTGQRDQVIPERAVPNDMDNIFRLVGKQLLDFGPIA